MLLVWYISFKNIEQYSLKFQQVTLLFTLPWIHIKLWGIFHKCASIDKAKSMSCLLISKHNKCSILNYNVSPIDCWCSEISFHIGTCQKYYISSRPQIWSENEDVNGYSKMWVTESAVLRILIDISLMF